MGVLQVEVFLLLGFVGRIRRSVPRPTVRVNCTHVLVNKFYIRSRVKPREEAMYSCKFHEGWGTLPPATAGARMM